MYVTRRGLKSYVHFVRKKNGEKNGQPLNVKDRWMQGWKEGWKDTRKSPYYKLDLQFAIRQKAVGNFPLQHLLQQRIS